MKSLVALIFVALITLPSFAKSNIDGIDPAKKSFQKWQREFTAYPSAEANQNEEGLVKVSFEIDVEGEMKNVSVESGLSKVYNDKAVEIVNAMPKAHLYENGFIEGTRFVLPVKFVLN